MWLCGGPVFSPVSQDQNIWMTAGDCDEIWDRSCSAQEIYNGTNITWMPQYWLISITLKWLFDCSSHLQDMMGPEDMKDFVSETDFEFYSEFDMQPVLRY